MDAGQLKRYLLGKLADEEQHDLDARVFEDDKLFADLMEGQADLVDAYVRDQLTPTDRAAFEQHLLAAPASQEKVRLVRTLLEALGELDHDSDVPAVAAPANTWSGWLSALIRSPGRRWAPATALVAAAIVAVGLLVDDWRLRTRLERLAAEYAALSEREQDVRQLSEAEQARANRLSETLQQLQSTSGQLNGRFQTDAGSVVALSLTPGLARANESAPELVIRRGFSTALFELGLDIGESVGNHRVVIETADGREVWRQDATWLPSATQVAVVVAIDVSVFEAGDYIVRLQERTPSAQVENLHTYRLRVVRDATR